MCAVVMHRRALLATVTDAVSSALNTQTFSDAACEVHYVAQQSTSTTPRLIPRSAPHLKATAAYVVPHVRLLSATGVLFSHTSPPPRLLVIATVFEDQHWKLSDARRIYSRAVWVASLFLLLALRPLLGSLARAKVAV